MTWRGALIVAMVVTTLALGALAVLPYLDEPTADPDWQPFRADSGNHR